MRPVDLSADILNNMDEDEYYRFQAENELMDEMLQMDELAVDLNDHEKKFGLITYQ